jgi:hypothetical protein
MCFIARSGAGLLFPPFYDVFEKVKRHLRPGAPRGLGTIALIIL